MTKSYRTTLKASKDNKANVDNLNKQVSDKNVEKNTNSDNDSSLMLDFRHPSRF